MSRKIERLVEAAMRRLGWLLPATIEDVRRAERELEENPVELPESLKDPMAIFDARIVSANTKH